MSASRRSSSTLFTATITGVSPRCSTCATRASSSVTPVTTSTTSTMTSADCIAASACALDLGRERGLLAGEAGFARREPAAGVDELERAAPATRPVNSLRSRVTPGCSSTIASRRPTMRLTSVDLPTFGRPTIATTGAVGGHERSARDEGGAVGGHDLDGMRAGPRRSCRRGSGRARARRQAAGSASPGAASASTRLRSAPVSKPVTPMLPPKNRWRPGAAPTLPGAARAAAARAPARRAAGEDRDGRVVHRRGGQPTDVMRGLGARGAVAVGGGAVDPGEEPAADTRRLDRFTGERGAHLGFERARHADAVLVLCARRRSPSSSGKGRPREQVVLVGRVDEAAAQRREVPRLPALDRVDVGRGFGLGVRAHLGLAVVRAHAERHHTERRELREAVEHAEQRVVEHRAVVDAGAHDDLAVHLDAGVEQEFEPAQARRAAPVAEQARAHVGIGGVDAHVQRPEPLGDHPLEVGFGEAGERREVSVEERQPVVVVLEVEALPHALRQLVDEAERAVVVAGPHPVEHRARELEAERRAVGLVDHERALEPAAAHLELDAWPVGVELVRDHVPQVLAVDRTTSSPASTPACAAGDPGATADDSCRGHVHKCTGTAPRTRLPASGELPWAAMPVEKVLLAEPRGLLRGRRDGDQGARLDGARVRAAGVLLPRDRPQPARRRTLPRPGRDLRRRRRRRAGGRAADALRPRIGARGRRRGQRGRPLRRQRGVPARHQGPPRGQGAGAQGLHDPVRRPRRPRRSRRHARRRARRDPPRRARRPNSTRRSREVADPEQGRDARPDDARPQRVDRDARADARSLPGSVDRVAQRPLLRDHQPAERARRASPPRPTRSS